MVAAMVVGASLGTCIEAVKPLGCRFFERCKGWLEGGARNWHLAVWNRQDKGNPNGIDFSAKVAIGFLKAFSSLVQAQSQAAGASTGKGLKQAHWRNAYLRIRPVAEKS